MDSIRTLDVLQLLQERVAILGGRDLSNRPVVCFPATSKRERMKHDDLRRLITYLTGIPRYDHFTFRLEVCTDLIQKLPTPCLDNWIVIFTDFLNFPVPGSKSSFGVSQGLL